MSIEVAGRLDPPAARGRYLVEWYRLELAEDVLKHTVNTLEASAATVGESAPVKLLAMLAVPADEVVFGVFTADSADVVAEVCHQAGIPAQRLTAAFAVRNPTVAERFQR
ncbi:MAG: hypothetical protein QOD90_5028 [Mycobacterium sp.]|jgi:hypothetical protein|nr:hypothetical protein [Mycobacterium sp.]